MWDDLLKRLLVRGILVVAILLVELFNDLDDGPVDYRVVERERDD